MTKSKTPSSLPEISLGQGRGGSWYHLASLRSLLREDSGADRSLSPTSMTGGDRDCLRGSPYSQPASPKPGKRGGFKRELIPASQPPPAFCHKLRLFWPRYRFSIFV